MTYVVVVIVVAARNLHEVIWVHAAEETVLGRIQSRVRSG